MAGVVDSHVAGNAAEAEGGELLRLVIGFEDLADLEDGLFVLVVGTEVMEGRRQRRRTVGGSVVDSQSKTNLPAGSQIIDEGWSVVLFKLSEGDSSVGSTTVYIHYFKVAFVQQFLTVSGDSPDNSIVVY